MLAMTGVTDYLQFGLAMIGWTYIMWKAGEWLTGRALSQWGKRRKESRQQAAVNELYDAFDLSKIDDTSTLRITAKGNLVIMMYRTGEK